MADAHANFAYSTVATAPSPASSGTSLVVAAADGAKFPAAPFNATVWPTSSQPTTANAEIVRVTAISTDTLTITRTQESTSARAIVIGDQIAATITAKTLTDVEQANSYLTSVDQVVAANTQAIVDDYLELSSSFVYELASGAELVVGDFATPLAAPDQNTNAVVTVADETVPRNSEVIFSDYYELSAPFGVEIANGGLVQVGTSPDIAPLLAQDGWVNDQAETWVYVSATSFKIVGVDLTAKYTTGTRIKLTDGATKYFAVVSSAFSTDTTVTIAGGSDYTLSGGIISFPYHSYAANPQGYPGWFNFTASSTGFSSTTSDVGRFCVNGRQCTLVTTIFGTSNATTFTFTAPIASKNTLLTVCAGSDNSLTVIVRAVFSAGSATVTMGMDSGSTPVQLVSGGFTATGMKGANGVLLGSYEI